MIQILGMIPSAWEMGQLQVTNSHTMEPESGGLDSGVH